MAAQLALAAARGEKPPADLLNAKVDNGAGEVPSALLTPVPVTKENMADTVIADGFYEPSEICRGKFRQGLPGGGHRLTDPSGGPLCFLPA